MNLCTFFPSIAHYPHTKRPTQVNTTPITIRISYSICNPCTEFHVARMQTKFCPSFPPHKMLIRPPLYGEESTASCPGRFTPAPTGYEVGRAPMPVWTFWRPLPESSDPSVVESVAYWPYRLAYPGSGQRMSTQDMRGFTSQIAPQLLLYGVLV